MVIPQLMRANKPYRCPECMCPTSHPSLGCMVRQPYSVLKVPLRTRPNVDALVGCKLYSGRWDSTESIGEILLGSNVHLDKLCASMVRKVLRGLKSAYVLRQISNISICPDWYNEFISCRDHPFLMSARVGSTSHHIRSITLLF